MAREIVITSVPRGVKLGRTGFQVAMQTAGMRDDLSSQLEKMAGYRHLPTGIPNPVCYFHRITKTFAGQVSVLGRIVDAGVDFSNRSNKLAHMVVLEPADIGQVGSSSPAATLAAIEGRLASSWPGPPEERREPFGLMGVPASQAARCGLWQRVTGDAGWAGVLADRAVRGQPTLVIASDSSPASCKQLLMLFQEALAIVPAAKRWTVTFDTTSLSPEGVLWRGTYAGSPESQAAQPGVLVVDLSRPQPIPQNLAAGDLVKIAREGPPAPVMPRTVGTTAPPVPGQGQPGSSGGVIGGSTAGGPQVPPTVPGGPRKLAPIGGGEWDAVPVGQRRKQRSYGGLIAGGIAIAVVLMLALGGVAALVIWPGVSQARALNRFNNYAQDRKNPPTGADLKAALPAPHEELSDEQAEAAVVFLNAWLASDEPEATRLTAVSSGEKLREILATVRTVMQPAKKPEELARSIRQLCPSEEPVDCEQAAKDSKGEGFKAWGDLAERVRVASQLRVERRNAFEAIKKYAKGRDNKSAPPSRDIYSRALGIVAEDAKPTESHVAFLNAVLASQDDTSSYVATEQHLSRLLVEVKAVVDADLPGAGGEGRGRNLEILVGGKDRKNIARLLDDIHPTRFSDYKTFDGFVRELVHLTQLPQKKAEDREKERVGEDLWKAILGIDPPLKERLGDDPKGGRFARELKEEDLADVGRLRAALDRVYPPKLGGSRGPVRGGGAQASELQKAIAGFREAVETGTVNCRERFGQGENGQAVELFAFPAGSVQKVAGRAGTKTDFVGIPNGAEVTIGGDQVLVLRQGQERWTVERGSAWEKHKDMALFLPIGFAKDGNSQVEANDWIVLSRPVATPLPSGKPTLHDLLFEPPDPVKVPLPTDLEGSVRLKLATCSIKGLDSPLKVEMQADPSGESGLLKITASIKTEVDGEKTEDVEYTLTERVSIKDHKITRLSGASWQQLRSRMSPLKLDHDTEVSSKEPWYVGFKTIPGRGSETALRDITKAMLESVAQATASARSATDVKYLAAEKYVDRWTPKNVRDVPATLQGWRHHLRSWLAEQSSGFADECRNRYDKERRKPPDPGHWKDDGPYKTRGEYDSAVNKYKAAVAAYVDDQMKDPESLRKYVDSKNGSANGKDMDAEVAAACFLLEIDGLIVAKVYREELEDVLKRIPIGALVRGDVRQKWDSWWAAGKESKAEPFFVKIGDLTPAAVLPAAATTSAKEVTEATTDGEATNP